MKDLKKKYASLTTVDIRHFQGKMYYDLSIMLDGLQKGGTVEAFKLCLDYILDSYEVWLSECVFTQAQRDKVNEFIEDVTVCYTYMKFREE